MIGNSTASYSHRRMLPGDIHECLKRSDVYDVVVAHGLVSRLEELLVHFLIHGQMWGSVVSTEGEPYVCFGSCFFVNDRLADALRAKQHPFLLCEICTTPAICGDILSYKRVIQENESQGLTFYGGLFTFPSFSNPIAFGKAMNALQESLLLGMSGFRLKYHFKSTYGEKVYEQGLTSFALRKMFGTNLLTDYGDQQNDLVRRFHPMLFGISRETAVRRHGKPIQALMSGGHWEMDLTDGMRYEVRDQIEQGALLGDEALDREQSEQRKSTRYVLWFRLFRRLADRNPKIYEFLGLDKLDHKKKRAVLKHVATNPSEMRILHPLTQHEIDEWNSTHLQRLSNRIAE